MEEAFKRRLQSVQGVNATKPYENSPMLHHFITERLSQVSSASDVI
ncbi:MAG: hypothetical protein HFI63_05190 [Lachnospiraceae bacterium]|nr:hypothetical protein [Lachnospiraceae bacterium]